MGAHEDIHLGPGESERRHLKPEDGQEVQRQTPGHSWLMPAI